MNNDIKKIIAGLIAGGALVGGGTAVKDKMDCKYVVEYKQEQICIDDQVKEILESQLPVSKGFGGVTFQKK